MSIRADAAFCYGCLRTAHEPRRKSSPFTSRRGLECQNVGFLRIALLAMLVVLFQGTWALAGTTGALNGLRHPAGWHGARGCQGHGNITFRVGPQRPLTRADTSRSSRSLPDTYTVTASKDGYDPTSQPGVTVLADSTQVARITLHPTVKVLGHVTTHGASRTREGRHDG